MFEVANLEESDVVFEDAKVDVYDVLDHDDVVITEFVVNDSIVAGWHLTKMLPVIRLLLPVKKPLKKPIMVILTLLAIA